MKLSNPEYLGPFYSLTIALIFPITYGTINFYKREDINFISVLGFVSILLTGGIGILNLDSKYIIIKETAIPLFISLIILISHNTKHSIVKGIFSEIFFIDKITLEFKKNHKDFNKNISISTYILVIVFLISSVLNFIIAKVLIKSPSGTPEFNQELGKMLALSFPIIAVPAIIISLLIIIYIVISVRKSTNLDFDDIFR